MLGTPLILLALVIVLMLVIGALVGMKRRAEREQLERIQKEEEESARMADEEERMKEEQFSKAPSIYEQKLSSKFDLDTHLASAAPSTYATEVEKNKEYEAGAPGTEKFQEYEIEPPAVAPKASVKDMGACVKCGSEIEAGAQMCPFCGTIQTTPDEEDDEMDGEDDGEEKDIPVVKAKAVKKP